MITITLEIPMTHKEFPYPLRKLTMKQLRKVLKGSFIHVRDMENINPVQFVGDGFGNINGAKVTYFVSKVKSLEHGK